jgi:predicted nucleic acid-binding protein
VATVYLDTSALGRVLLGEPGAAEVLSGLGAFSRRVSSGLLRVELRRLALRHGVLAAAEELLAGVALVPLDAVTLAGAETIEPREIATLDAIHLATCVRMADALDAVMTYDAGLARGVEHHGLAVLAPS